MQEAPHNSQGYPARQDPRPEELAIQGRETGAVWKAQSGKRSQRSRPTALIDEPRYRFHVHVQKYSDLSIDENKKDKNVNVRKHRRIGLTILRNLGLSAMFHTYAFSLIWDREWVAKYIGYNIMY